MVIVAGRPALADAARRATQIALGATIVLSPFRARIELLARPTAAVYGDFTDLLLFWSDIAVVVTLGAWLLSLLARPRPISVGPRFLAYPVVGLLIVAALGVPFATDIGLAAYHEIRLAVLALLALCAINEVDRIDRVVPSICLMVVVQAIVGIGQALSQHSLGIAGLGEHELSPSLGVSVVTAADGVRYLRAYGLADHPNILGGVLTFALLLIAGSVARRSAPGPSLATVTFGIGAATLFVTFSRGAWLGLVVGLLALGSMLAVRRDRASIHALARVLLAGAIICLPFVAPFVSVLEARSDTSGQIVTEARSLNERSALVEVTNQVFSAHPVLGVGIGALPLAIEQARPAFDFQYQPSSVVLLDVAAETGLFGAAFYAVIVVAPWLAMLRHRARWTVDLAGSSAALAAVTIVGLFDYYTWSYSAGRIWSWLVLAMWAVAYRTAAAGQTDAA
ncbi:MAG: O-antigen ligase family protein [Candidatus Limnocylindrales bacterium]|nr:O-antigen ligase family protein [Candidatus Limnocylindrales bacterium]